MEPAERSGSGTTLGKRPRSRVLPRTASMVTVPSAAKQGRQEGGADVTSSSSLSAATAGMGAGGGGAAARAYYGGFFSGAETAAFLKACGLCNRRLGPGSDTFIYRGEVAFCSQECREQQIEYDERMEKSCSLTSIKDAAPGASGSDQSGSGGETVAAA
ncbi:hypothetical protein ACP70R_027811 [Stipagrostis hirtigluma subsp. patula]